MRSALFLLAFASLLTACPNDVAVDIDDDGDGFPSRADCNDNDAAISPDAIEVCDGIDNNCNSIIDLDAAEPPVWFADADGDGAGNDDAAVAICEAPEGFIDEGGDCDDGNALVSPTLSELCDGLDNDCNGTPDFAGGEEDADGDTALACEDCDDNEASAADFLPEVCDGIDNDCDGDIDEDSALGAGTWFADADGDGFGDDSVTTVACDQPNGFVAQGGDCDDLVAAAFPGSVEICDLADNDCDGTIDGATALGADTFWTDGDTDGYGDPGAAVVACDQPAGTVTNDDDCDDTTAAIAPGEPETCNGIDDDCDSVIDDGASPLVTFYADADSDTYGSPGLTLDACAQPVGFVGNADDCDDGESTVYLGATEVCDGLDNDCDTVVPADEMDADGDGVLVCDGDCDDTNASVSPNVAEVCDGLDNDCDTIVDNGASPGTWYPDYDGDSFGNPAFPVVTCSPAAGYVTDGSDCDDLSASNAPGAPELCDGVDNDCDTVIDNGLSPQDPYYLDDDADGFGLTSAVITACAQPAGYVAVGGDCDDTDAAFSPVATELCLDGLDNDCDTLTDCDELVDCKPTEPTCWVCGDNIVDPDETCDDGGFAPGDGCDEFCQDESPPIDLTGVYSQFPSDGRTIYFWQSDANAALSPFYDTFCEDRGLDWFEPLSAADAQLVIDNAYSYDTWHTWIVTKANTGAGTWGGFPVVVDNPSCVGYSSTGWSAIRKWSCSYCDPETYNQTRCWDSNHVYDWLVCEGP
ncbi:MAG: hypothetical protein KDA24_03740 [Deltaproteobacteria bacterium]|nr:hypothetical protein [Deltaproteobacteria bacterium]